MTILIYPIQYPMQQIRNDLSWPFYFLKRNTIAISLHTFTAFVDIWHVHYCTFCLGIPFDANLQVTNAYCTQNLLHANITPKRY